MIFCLVVQFGRIVVVVCLFILKFCRFHELALFLFVVLSLSLFFLLFFLLSYLLRKSAIAESQILANSALLLMQRSKLKIKILSQYCIYHYS